MLGDWDPAPAVGTSCQASQAGQGLRRVSGQVGSRPGPRGFANHRRGCGLPEGVRLRVPAAVHAVAGEQDEVPAFVEEKGPEQQIDRVRE